MKAERNGDISFWYADMGGIPAPRSPLPRDLEADVAIIGAVLFLAVTGALRKRSR